MPRGPDFFLVGAPKSGTTSMTEYLRQHPEIYIPPDKEFHYFGSDVRYDDVFENVRDEATYFAQFEPAGEDQVVGETSTMNLYSKRAAREIAEYDSSARILAMLRNPVDMLHSLHSHYLYGGNEDIEDFEEALAAEEDRKRGERIPESARFVPGLFYREMVRYSEQLKRYFDVFDRDQVKVLILEAFAEKTERHYRETLEFLGVDPSFQPDFEVHNPNVTVRSRVLNRFVRNPPGPVKWFVQVVDRALPASLFRVPVRTLYRTLNTRRTQRPSLPDDLRKRLEKELKPEVRQLSRLLDRDLSRWWF